MKKLLATVLTAALVLAAAISSVSAKCEKNDKATVFKFDTYTAGTKDPYKTSASDDAIISVYTWNSGTLAFADGAFTLTPKADGGNMFEGVINDASWHLPVDQYKFLKLRYKTSAASAFAPAVTYYMPSNKTKATFDLKLTGNWEETVVDLTKLDGLDWSSYKDDYEKSASLGTNKVRSFRFDFPKDSKITYTIAYIGFFKTEADAKAFDGTMASLEKKVTTTTTAAQTADATAIVVAAAVISLGMAAIVIKKRK